MGEAALVIDRPQDLDVPEPDKFSEILSSLSEDGQARFILEILTALKQSQESGNLIQLQRALDAWWYSRAFVVKAGDRLDPALANAAAAPLDDNETRYTADQIAELLGVE